MALLFILMINVISSPFILVDSIPYILSPKSNIVSSFHVFGSRFAPVIVILFLSPWFADKGVIDVIDGLGLGVEFSWVSIASILSDNAFTAFIKGSTNKL